MAELADRMDIEADFARKMARASSQHRKELWSLLSLINPQIVPEDFWQKVEAEKKKQMNAALLLIFMASADQHANTLIPGDLRAAAQDSITTTGAAWASTRASDLARQYVETSREKLNAAYDKWYGPDFQVRRVFGDMKPAVSHQEALDDLVDIFGPERDARIAATETTGAATAGAHGARGAAEELGIKTEVIWRTEADGKVCPVCAPLDGLHMGDWEGALASADVDPWAFDAINENGGPPIHPSCRCWLDIIQTKES